MALRISHLLFRLFAVLLAVVIIAAAALGVRLASGPIQLTWLAPYVARAITPADQQIRIEVGDAQLRLGLGHTVELVGIDVRAKGPDGELLIELPEIEVALSLDALLTRGMLAPTRLEASAPRLVLARGEDGRIRLGGLPSDDQQATPQGQIDVAALLAPLMTTDPSQPLSYLNQLQISGGRLTLEDRITKHTLMAEAAELSISRHPEGLSGNLAFDLAQHGPPAHVQTSARFAAATGQTNFRAGFERLDVAELVRIEPALPLQGVELALDGQLTGTVDLAGAFSPLTFELRAAAGVIRRPELLSGPLPIESLSVNGQVAADLETVEIDRLQIASNGAQVDGKGRVAWPAGQLTVQAEVEAENVAAHDLALYWPPVFGTEARDWVVANITDGVVPKAQVTIRLQPGDLAQKPIPEGTVEGRFDFQGLTVRYFETMPPLTAVDGSATFTARTMDFVVTGGQVGEIRLDKGSVAIKGIGLEGRDTTPLKVTAEIDSSIDAALGLIDRPPLGFATDLGINPASTSGRVHTHLEVSMPLNRDLEASDIRMAAAAQLRDAGIQGLRNQIDLSDGQFSLTVDNDGANLVGEGSVDQIPLAIEWREHFGRDAPYRRRFHVSGEVEPQSLARFGVDLPIPAEGSFGVDATLVDSAGLQEVDLALDLTPLAIELPWLDWRKAPGEAGRLTATVFIPGEGPIQVEAFELSGAGLDAAGSLQLRSGPPQLQTLVLTRFRTRGSEATLDLQRENDGAYQISVQARSLDLGPVLKAHSEIVDGGAPTPFSLTLTADRVLLGGHSLSAVDAHVVRDDEGWRAANIRGRLPKGGELAISLTPEADQRQLYMTSDDAGDLLQTLDQTARIDGGQLKLKGVILRQAPALDVQGTLQIKQFTVLDAPVLARLLTVASLTGIRNLLGGEGIHFDRLELPFTLHGDVLSIDKGRVSGSQLGLTAKGTVDLARGRLDLDGTIVPIYGLNWAIGKIPLVGQFLSGSEGEGAFAVTYTVRGALSEPEISVNPLSVLAPGFLRDLFSGLSEGTLEPPVVPNRND